MTVVSPGFRDPRRPRVWLFDVSSEWFEDMADAGVASPEERARAEALTDPAAGRRLLARRAGLRTILAAYLGAEPGRVHPRDLKIVTAPGGKPVMLPSDHGAVAFSVAHSGDLYAIAAGRVESLGLDVERHRAVPRARAIADRWFSSDEASRLEGLRESEMEPEFMRLWTGKEALAKRHGAGLRLMTGQGNPLDIDAAIRASRLAYFDVGEGYTAALASTDPIDQVDVIVLEENPWTI